MDRREFLITSGGAAVAAASPAAAATDDPAAHAADVHGTAAAGTELRMAMRWSDTPQGPADSARRLARRFEAMTGGRYRITITDAADGADLVHGSAHDFADTHPAFAYFAGLPGASGLSATDLAHWIAVGGGQMLWDDLAARSGWKPLLAGHSGEAPPLWSRQPITSLADLAGRRMHADGLAADVARALGAETPSAPRSPLADALARDEVFAAEGGGLLESLAAGLPRVARHATGSGLNASGTAYCLSVRLDAWERMSDADRTILSAAATEAYHEARAEARAHETLVRGLMATSLGVRFAPWPTDVAEALGRVAEATIAHVAGHDEIASRIDQSYMAFRAAVQGTIAPRRATPTAPTA